MLTLRPLQGSTFTDSIREAHTLDWNSRHQSLYIEIGKEKKPFLALIASSSGEEWRCGLSMQKNLGRIFGRTSTDTRSCMTAWSVYSVRVYTSR